MDPQNTLFEARDQVVEIVPVQTQDELVDLLIEKDQEKGNIPVSKEADDRVRLPRGVPEPENDQSGRNGMNEHVDPPPVHPFVKKGDKQGYPHEVGQKNGVLGAKKLIVQCRVPSGFS